MDDAANRTPDPEFPSGEWIGFYNDSGSKHRQEMHLTFSAGRMLGAGGDDIGEFIIRGSYDTENKEARWTKTYPGSHSVYYKGYRETKGIWGLWEIPPVAKNGFHIWPRAYGEQIGEHTTADKEEPTLVTASGHS